MDDGTVVDADVERCGLDGAPTGHPIGRGFLLFRARISSASISFDVVRMQEALDECLARQGFLGDMQDQGFAALPLTRRPGAEEVTETDLSGRFWTCVDDSYAEVAREELVDEFNYSELIRRASLGPTSSTFMRS